MLKSICRIAPAVILPLTLSACMGLSVYSPTRNKLDAQVGKNINEMLPAWPPETGAKPFVNKVDDQTTSYTYVYGYHPGHYEGRGHSTNGPMGTTYGSYSAYVPEYTDCAVIFYTDKAGTVLRYDMKTNGKISYNSCGEYISGFRF